MIRLLGFFKKTYIFSVSYAKIQCLFEAFKGVLTKKSAECGIKGSLCFLKNQNCIFYKKSRLFCKI